ncbi:bifunctional UDP-N-acetylglucosamine diphosphorylase/glucosamine-1-phosphate N-acetyltransferase GlmU [Spiractinospora alimapuensis]|uniref:bifunctional UDP-N-acetylglucosamine diphosphorylase/glucosamine-1-phosphate N-acetyltransferase GlmU n=1 Tax=Spiractinospora alimapuensis TaxID=2820884 RepID=UPI001EEA963F|nr:bifunctional UDP-N-acetylglucosamine diphosphorylase/glucosamine-1-phosphate N-acetyltransferase GlmU [Spiractinospora alimapuensis]QVQ51401.1 bifunctional UDP-N-acetylglucosamine diphosphorylase/glucosamine-1-phosphate N-acetyltransferase GlmU [Spiractinospora alimapuensis]
MSASRPAAVIVLAAGEGTRMRSRTPKVLHEICGRSLVAHVLAAAAELAPQRTVVVVGHERERVSAHVDEVAPGVTTAVQDKQNGTGHAVRMALDSLAGDDTTPADALSGTVVLCYGDTPLLRGRTLGDLVAAHEAGGNAATVLSAHLDDPTGYGRIIRDSSGACAGIVEEADATADQRAITEINSGMYAFDGAALAAVVQRLSTDNAKGEEYITDTVALLRGDGLRVGVSVAEDAGEIEGVNDRVQLAAARASLNRRLLETHMRAGVTVVDPASTLVDVDVTIGQDAVIEPQTQLLGGTVVGDEAHVGPGARLTDTAVGAGATVSHTVAEGAEIGERAVVGPYSYLRPGARLGGRAKVGTFVEVKNSNVGEGTKIPHLTYVGDADIGKEANIGASSVFVNYDGVHKNRTVVGDHARTGSDTMFIAPVNVGDGAYTGAGTVVREDVPPGALAVSEGHRQRNIDGWVRSRRPGTAAADAAERATSAED